MAGKSAGETLRNFLEMIRFSHTLFALPFAVLAALMAVRAPASPPLEWRWGPWCGLVLAMVGGRSAAMAFNRLVDRRWDAANPRTAGRHLPAGKLSVGSVVWFTFFSVALYLAGAALFWPNYLPLLLALPVLAIVLLYSYTKRFTALAHFWLGLALMLAPVCAWIGMRGEQVLADFSDLTPALVLGLAVLFWVAGFDMIYACQDYEYDRRAGLRSVPARWGIWGALRLAAVCHGVMVVLLALLPWAANWAGLDLGLSSIYGWGVLAITALLIYEHSLVSPRDLSRVNQAFFNVNALISLGLLAVTGIDLWW